MPETKKPAIRTKDEALQDPKAATDTVDPSKADPSDALKVVDKKSGP